MEPVAEVSKKEEPKKEEPKIEIPKVEPSLGVEKQPEQELIKARADKLQGLKVVDRIQLPVEKEKKKDAPVASSDTQKDKARDPVKGFPLLTINKDNKTRVNQEVRQKAPALSNSSNAEMHRLPEFRRLNQQKRKFKIRSGQRWRNSAVETKREPVQSIERKEGRRMLTRKSNN